MSKEAIAIKALEALARLGNGDQYGNSTGNVIARTALFEMAEQPAQDNTYGYAKGLAESLFKKHYAHEEHYASGRIVWEVSDTTIGLLTQIDNMVCTLVRPAEQSAREWVGLTEVEKTDLWTRGTNIPFSYADAIEAKLKEKNT